MTKEDREAQKHLKGLIELLPVLIFFLSMSWLGALSIFVWPNLSRLTPLDFGLLLSGISFLGSLVVWLYR